MKGVYVFDGSALIELFRSYRPVVRFLDAADAGEAQVVFPAAAIAEANTFLRATESAWAPVLMGRINCLPLTEQVAVAIGLLSGEFGDRHVVYEARAMWANVVTAEPDRYKPHTVPLIVI